MESLNIVEEKESVFHTNKINRTTDINNPNFIRLINFLGVLRPFDNFLVVFHQKLQFSLIDYLKSKTFSGTTGKRSLKKVTILEFKITFHDNFRTIRFYPKSP